MVVHTLISARHKEWVLCGFKVSPVYTVSGQPGLHSETLPKK